MILINLISGLLVITIGFLIYILLLYIRRPGTRSTCKDVFIHILSSQKEHNSYAYDEYKIMSVVAEVEYGIKYWHSNEDVTKLQNLQGKYNRISESTGEGRPGKIMDILEAQKKLPQKQPMFKRLKTFIYLWWRLKDDHKNCYYPYFRSCIPFVIGKI